MIDLTAVDDDKFVELVNRDIREQASDEEYEALRHEDVLQRWYDTLISSKRDLEYQFSMNRANRAAMKVRLLTVEEGSHTDPAQLEHDHRWLKYLAENESWRIGALKFYRGVERRLGECSHLLSTANRKRSHADCKYRQAIEWHKTAILNTEEDDTSTLDDRLWATID